MVEHTFTRESDAHTNQREWIDRGYPVSLVAFDPVRNVYAFDVYPRGVAEEAAGAD